MHTAASHLTRRALTASATAAALLLVAGATVAGASRPSVPAAPAGDGWVEGVAVDGAGRPVAGALVNVLDTAAVPEPGLLADRTDRRAWTGADGSFRVRQAPTGYLVQICVPDPDVRTVCRETAAGVDFAITYVGGSGVTDSWVLQRSLLPGTAGRRDLGEVTVRPVAHLSGTVTGGVAGQEVRLMRLNDSVAFRTWTDQRGRYRLDGLVPGRYYVASGGAGTLPWSSDPVDLVADATTTVDASLRRGAVIRGRLRSGTSPVRRVEVLVTRPGHGPVASALTDRRGRFEVSGLVPGRYRAGIAVPGTAWRPHLAPVVIESADQVVRPVVQVQRGARVVVELREDGRATPHTRVELRDGHRAPVFAGASDEHGRVTFEGLPAGRWSVVAAGEDHYGLRSFRVDGSGSTRLRPLPLDRPLLTIRGRTAPHAVVEATTGDFCPPDGHYRYGTFHQIVQADADGDYRIPGLVPGRYMLGADGWPRRHAPRCWSGVEVRDDLRRDLPLETGVVATGRLVYAGTGQPVVTSLSYELFHRPGSATNPTEEHPARGRTVGSTGRFTIRRLAPEAQVTGRLARDAGEGINDESFFVTLPFQDGTPYWLDTAPLPQTVPTSGRLELGDIPVTVHGR